MRKPLHLLSYDGSIRPGRATLEQISDVLDGRESDRLATISIEDGVISTHVLTVQELDQVRTDLIDRQRAALRLVLDHALTVVRDCADIRGVSCYNGLLTISIEEAPWAEDVARDWAEKNDVFVEDEPLPQKPGTWTRHAYIRTERSAMSWLSTIATLRWPSENLTDFELVARDAEALGRTKEAEEIRAAGAPPVEEEGNTKSNSGDINKDMPF